MSWNYRVIQIEYKGVPHWEIREVFYGESGEVEDHSAENAFVGTNDKSELPDILEKMKAALDKPVVMEIK